MATGDKEPEVIITPTTVSETTPENLHSLLVVSATLGVVLVFAMFWVLGPWWGLAGLAYAIYECWTLLNKFKQDSISEATWILSQRPIVVLIFGVSLGIAIGTGYLGDVKTVLRSVMIGLLYGHFFFSREDKPFVAKLK